MATEVELFLRTNVKAATDSVKGFADSANAAVAGVSKTFDNLQRVAIAAIAGIGFKKMIDAASEADDAVTQLNTALKLSGDFSQASSQGFQDYASSIQSSTKFTEEAVLSNVALSKSYGLTNAEAKKVSQAALQLATIQGTTLDQATKQLNQTFDGTAGKLAQTVPALQNLTKEQLQAGAAADIIAKQFAGAAEAAGSTFSGSLTIASHSFGEIIEKFGLIITQNPVLIKIIKLATKAFDEFAAFIEKNSQAIADFVNAGIVGLVKALAVLVGIVSGSIRILGGLVNVLISVGQAALATIGGLSLFEGIGNTFAGLAKIVALAGTSIVELIRLLLSIPGADLGLKSMGTSVEEVNAKLDAVNESAFQFVDTFKGSDIAPAMDKASQALDKVKGSVTAASGAIADKLDSAKVEVIKFGQVIEKEATKKLIKLGSAADDIKPQIANLVIFTEEAVKKIKDLASKNVFASLFGTNADLNVFFKEAESKVKRLQKQMNEELFVASVEVTKLRQAALDDANNQLSKLKAEANKAITIGAASSLVEGISKGAQGAAPLMSKILGGAIESILPGFGGIASQIFDILAQGPEKVKEMINGFIQAIPTIIQNVILSLASLPQILIEAIPTLIEGILNAIPTIVEGLINSIGPFIEALVAAVPRIISSLIEKLPDLISALAVQLPFIATTFATELIKHLPEIVLNLSNQMPVIATRFAIELIKNIPAMVKEMVAQIAEQFKSIGSIFSGGGGGGLGGLLPFAGGGIVPGVGNTDSVPSILTPGEIVIPKDIAQKILQSGSSPSSTSSQQSGGSQLIQVVLQIGEKQLAEAILNLNRQGFRTA